MKSFRIHPEALRGSVCPHKQLWCAVLLQAVDDARGKGSGTSGDCMEARSWLTIAANKWRSIVCDYAGICEESLVKKSRELYS